MSKRFNFTQASISAINSPPKGERLVVWDTQVSGLQCRISHQGVKVFSLYRRVRDGKPERVTLGKFGDITVKQARDEATQINAAIAKGANPAEIKRVNKAEMTFEELFFEYIEKHSKQKKLSWKQDVGKYNRYLKKPLGHKRISKITRADIAAIHSDVTSQLKFKKPTSENLQKFKSGGTANRVWALISSVFGWAINAGHCENNPARGIKKNKERSRDRFLQSDELPRFFASLAEEENTAIRDFVLLALLTGARRANILSMRWEQISFERKEWRIPRTKNGESQTVPLGDEAIEILKERKGNNSDFVFSSDGKNGHLVEPKKGWNRILKRAGIEDLRVHDLRRTLGSWQARTGASLVIVGKSLGHKSPQATAIYSRLDLDPVRKSMETATTAIFKAAKQDKKPKLTLSPIFNIKSANNLFWWLKA